MQTIALPSTLPTCVHVERSSSFPGHTQTQRLLLCSVVKRSRTILEVLLNFRSCCDEGTKKLSLNHGGRHRKAGRKRSQMKGRSYGEQVWRGTDQGRLACPCWMGLISWTSQQRKAQHPVLPPCCIHGAERSKEKKGPCKSQVQGRSNRKALGEESH